MNNKIVEIMSFAVFTESIITYFKEFFVNGDFSFSILFSIILGIVIAIAYKLDLPEYLNLKSSIPYIGNILTGYFNIERQQLYLWYFKSTYEYKIRTSPITKIKNFLCVPRTLLLRNKKLSTHKITQKEYYNNVLTTANAECIIKVVGVKPFEKRSASKDS